MQTSENNLIGESIGNRYQVESELGRGALGVVFRARDILLERVVAIKVIQDKMSSDTVAALRFQREARLAASLQHANIVTVFDFGVLEDNRPYLVMEFLAGETIEDVLKRSMRMNAVKAVPMFMSVCQALAHAHKAGIVHRDLKPGNIMLLKDDTGNEVVKLVDFGIAKPICDQDSDLTAVGSVIGTPSYMSPEQCLGKPLDTRSDIYSLGCVMYHVLTGVRPLTGQSSLETLTKQVSEQPRAFSEVAGGVQLPDTLERCVFRALMKAPGDRQQSVVELREELEQAITALWAQKGSAGREKPDDEKTVVVKPKPAVTSPEPFGFSPYPEIHKAPKVVPDEKPTSPDFLLDRAQNGDGYAMYQYAVALENGNGVEKDEKEALFWYRKSSAAGCPDGQNELASIYQWGALGLEPDEKEAMRLYSLAAEQGHAKAQNSCGYFLEEDNPKEAVKWYKAAAENGYSTGMSNYARCIYYGIGSDKKYDEAFKWLIKAAEADDKNDGAQYMLGILYFNGDGVEKDLVRSAQWYRKAAENGHESAQYELALCYLYGDGVEANTDEAIHWFKAGSALGDTRCEEKLAELTSEGAASGLTVDDVDQWMRKSTVNAVDVAEHQLLVLLKTPHSDMNQAVCDLEPAAQKGSETAMLLMGRFCEMGMGVAQDYDTAYYWYKLAYDRGSAIAEQHAITCLRLCFENNIFPEGAESFLRTCANKRNTKAMISLAYYYRFYNPDGRDFAEALRFYRQAAESGDSEAQYLLGRFLVMKNLLKRERNKVIRWWDSALEKGLSSATTEEFDEEGHKTERAEAMRWLNAAGEEGSCDALRLLSSMYHRGLLVLSEPETSVKLLARAAEMDDVVAQGLLGVIFLEGIGVEKSQKKGVEYLELASDAGNSFAQWNLALALIEGQGVLINRPRAKALLERAAEGGFTQDRLWSEDGFEGRFQRLLDLFQDLSSRGQVDANYWLGICYEKGLGVAAQRDKALELYLRSAKEGCHPAQAAFDRQPENLKKLAEKRSQSTKESVEVNTQRAGLTQAIKVVRDADTVSNRVKLYEALNAGELVLPGIDKGNGSQPVTITNARAEVGVIVFSGKRLIAGWDADTEFILRSIVIRDLCSIALAKSMEAVILDPTKSGGVILRKWEMEAFSKAKLPIERGKTWTWVQVTVSSGTQISLRCADIDTVARCGATIKQVLERHQMVKRGMIFSCFFEPVNEPEQLAVGIEPQPNANKEQALELNNDLLALGLQSDTGLPLKVVFVTNPLGVQATIKNSNVLFER